MILVKVVESVSFIFTCQVLCRISASEIPCSKLFLISPKILIPGIYVYGNMQCPGPRICEYRTKDTQTAASCRLYARHRISCYKNG